MTSVKEELEEAWNPNDMVLAIIPDPANSLGVCQALQEAGFASDDIATFQGDEATEHLDVEGKRSENPFAKPIRAIWSYFSIEGPQLRTYEEASEAGQDVVAVRALNDEAVASAHKVLVRFGATEIRHFTQWNIADLPEDQSAA